MVAFEMTPGFPKLAFSLLLILHIGVIAGLFWLQAILALAWLPIALLISRQFQQQQCLIRCLRRNPQGEWKLLPQDKPWDRAQLAGSSLVWDNLVILNLTAVETGNCTLVLDRTSLSTDDWRRLRVSLRLNRQCSETLPPD